MSEHKSKLNTVKLFELLMLLVGGLYLLCEMAAQGGSFHLFYVPVRKDVKIAMYVRGPMVCQCIVL